ncbi:hypothetical protein ACFQU2_40080 [Siccirubricoccus deserti]
MVAIGLGAQSESITADITLSDGTLRWVQAINESRPTSSLSNIYTRGPYTSQQLERFDIRDTVVGGCPRISSTRPATSASASMPPGPSTRCHAPSRSLAATRNGPRPASSSSSSLR